MFKRKPPLPTSIEFSLKADGVIDLDPETGWFKGTVKFTPTYWVDGEPFYGTWQGVNWRTISFCPPGRRLDQKFTLDEDEVAVMKTFEEPWEFTMDTTTIDEATTVMARHFAARVDEYMAVLTKRDTHRDVDFEGRVATGAVTLKPYYSGSW